MDNESPPAPRTDPPSPSAQPASSGSLLLGVGLAWAIVAVGYMLAYALLLLGSGLWPGIPGVTAMALLIAPEVLAIVAAVVLINRGKPRTGRGILIGLASIAGVVLLLVAACFGLVFSGGLR